MDLNTFDTIKRSEEGVWYSLLHPQTGEPTDVQFRLAGPDSATYRNSEKSATKQRNHRVRTEASTDFDFTDDEVISLLAPCVLAWRNVQMAGKSLEYSPENVKLVLSSFPIVRRQINGFINNSVNFLTKVAENLGSGERGASA